MGHIVINLIVNEAFRMPELEKIQNGKNLPGSGKQLPSNDQIRKVIKKIIEPYKAREVRKHHSRSIYPIVNYKQF